MVGPPSSQVRTWRTPLTESTTVSYQMHSPSDPPDSSTLPESLRLLTLIWGLRAALERTSHAMEDKLGVTGTQRFLLRFVGLAPGISCAGLLRVVALNPADLRADLEALVAKNFLAEQQESGGYYLTAQGATVNAAMAGTVEGAVSKALDEATPYERAAFQKMLDRVLRQLAPPTP